MKAMATLARGVPACCTGALYTYRHLVRFLLLSIFVTMALIFSPAGDAQGTGLRVESFSLAPNGQVRVENARGSTSIEVWDSQSVRVIAEKVGNRDSLLDSSELVLMSTQDTVLIQCKQSRNPGRINFVIYVPRRAHLQVVGGAWPVEVRGTLSSLVVDTTSGPIEYRVPKTLDARVVMNSSRGTVRTMQNLTVTSRRGAHGLQGSMGRGTVPIILNSQSGNVTL